MLQLAKRQIGALRFTSRPPLSKFSTSQQPRSPPSSSVQSPHSTRLLLQFMENNGYVEFERFHPHLDSSAIAQSIRDQLGRDRGTEPKGPQLTDSLRLDRLESGRIEDQSKIAALESGRAEDQSKIAALESGRAEDQLTTSALAAVTLRPRFVMSSYLLQFCFFGMHPFRERNIRQYLTGIGIPGPPQPPSLSRPRSSVPRSFGHRHLPTSSRPNDSRFQTTDPPSYSQRDQSLLHPMLRRCQGPPLRLQRRPGAPFQIDSPNVSSEQRNLYLAIIPCFFH